MKRTSCIGIGISACMVVPSRSRRSSTPTVMPPFWMKGKGCAGSTAIGVRIGRYWDVNWRSSHSRSAGVSSFGSTMWMPAAAISVLSAGPARLLVADEAGGEAVDLGELLGGRQAVLAQAA